MSVPNPKIAESAARLLTLEGKVALVTGAASGIGRGIAVRLAEMGAFLALLDIDEAGTSETEAAIKRQSGEAISLKCDVRFAADCCHAVESVIEKRSHIDILCNCAGIAIRKDVVELTEDEWDRVVDANANL